MKSNVKVTMHPTAVHPNPVARVQCLVKDSHAPEGLADTETDLLVYADKQVMLTTWVRRPASDRNPKGVTEYVQRLLHEDAAEALYKELHKVFGTRGTRRA
jgi:hypothetical protein